MTIKPEYPLGRVAVIGANGFVGSRLVEVLHLSGLADVLPIVRRASSMARSSRFNLSVAIADSTVKKLLSGVLNGCTSLVDCTVGLPYQIEAGAQALIPAAYEAGVQRVVYLSSASVHGQNPPLGSDEESPLSDQQEMPYNNSKVRAERCLFAAAKRYGIELFVLRPSIVFGPRDRWISTLHQQLITETAWLVNGGNGICNTIYVDNLIEAIRCCLLASADVSGQPYLVGDGDMVTWRSLYEKTARALNISPDSIQYIDIPPYSKRNLIDQLHKFRASPYAQNLIALFPSRFKSSVKGMIKGFQPYSPQSPWQLPSSKANISPEREMVLLQQCCHQFPYDRAFSKISYRPLFTFDEGLSRSISWLKWAGF